MHKHFTKTLSTFIHSPCEYHRFFDTYHQLLKFACHRVNFGCQTRKFLPDDIVVFVVSGGGSGVVFVVVVVVVVVVFVFVVIIIVGQ